MPRVKSNPSIIPSTQPEISEADGITPYRFELISVIWQAVESLTSPDLMKRAAGLDQLVEFDAIRQLPLAVYLLISRITEPDIEFRTRIVKTLANLLASIGTPSGPTFEVQVLLYNQLSEIRTREVFALLQVAEYAKSVESGVAELLSCCSFAGSHLAQILANRDAPKEIRRQAASFIGLIGYLDALPALERLTSRLESRKEEEDSLLLPACQSAVQLLTAL